MRLSDHDDDSDIDPPCRGSLDLFFDRRQAQIEEAKALCAMCPMIDDCLEKALYLDARFGVWGGTTPAERRDIRRQRRTAITAITAITA